MRWVTGQGDVTKHPCADRSCPTKGVPAGDALVRTLQRGHLSQDSGSVLSEGRASYSGCAQLPEQLTEQGPAVTSCSPAALELPLHGWGTGAVLWESPSLCCASSGMADPPWPSTLAKTWNRTRMASLEIPVKEQRSCAVLTL